MPTLNLAMAIQKQYLPRSVVSLLMVLWCSGKNATLFAHVMCPRVQCSILDVVTIFDYIYNGDSHGIPAEFQWNSNGIPQIPMGIIPEGSWILTISIRIPWKKVGISMELETKMAEAPANCFPLKFHGIPQNSDFPLRIQRNPQELMEEGKDLVGIAISCNCTDRTISISQTALIDHIIQQFGQTEADPISTPMDPAVAKSLTQPSPSDPPLSATDSYDLSRIPYCSLIGSLMYLAVGTHPDILFAIACLCQFLDCYCHAHWNAAIHVVHYLKGTQLLALTLGGDPDLRLVGFSDSSYANCPDTACSTMGYYFSVDGAVFTWSSHHQKTVTNSPCEAEYIVLSKASHEAIWLWQFLCEVHFLKPSPTVASVTTMVPSPCLLTLPTIHVANTSTSATISFTSTLKMASLWCGVFPAMTMLPTSLQRPYLVLISCVYIPS